MIWVLPLPGSPRMRTALVRCSATVVAMALKQASKACLPMSPTSASGIPQGSATTALRKGLSIDLPQTDHHVIISLAVGDQIVLFIGIAHALRKIVAIQV